MTGMSTEKMELAQSNNKLVVSDRQAFGELVLKHQQRILNLAFRLSGDKTAAEDIAQEVFVRAYESYKSFRGGAEVFTWLYRITVNLTSKYHRKRKWESLFSFMTPVQKEFWRIDENQHPDVQAEKNEEKRIVHKALLMLPESQKTLLVLRRWEGMSYKEIAEITGLSLSAVESKIHRALKNLGKILPGLLERSN